MCFHLTLILLGFCAKIFHRDIMNVFNFTHFDIQILVTNEMFMRCGPIPDSFKPGMPTKEYY